MGVITPVEKSYIAALIENRLRLYIIPSKAASTGNILIMRGSMNSDAIADFLARKIGGTLNERKKTMGNRKPCSQHCKTAHEHYEGYRVQTFQANASRATIVLHNVLPYCIDRIYVDPYYEFGMKNRNSGGKACWKHRTIQDMKDRGWDIP